jgi:preprotein translocase subunit SecD
MQIGGCLQIDAEAAAVCDTTAAGMDAMTEIVTVTVLFAAPDGTGEAVGMAEPSTVEEATNWLLVSVAGGTEDANAEDLAEATNVEEDTMAVDTAEVPSTDPLVGELTTPSEPEPLMPPVAPVAAIRASASA